jgi:Ca2+-binding RTX toxin-like protein
MSDVQVPNIDFDTETSLTIGPGHDDILGTAGNDLVFGASGGPGTTLGPADIIRGGPDGMNMLSVTFTTNSPQTVGFLSRDMDVFQSRAFNSGTAYTNMIDVTGTSVLWLDQNTGNTEFDFVQNLLDIVATGGDFYTDINYVAGVAGGPNQDQEILVEGVDADIDIEGGVQNLWLQANGAAHSIVDIDSDATNVMLKGNGPSVDLELDSGAYVATFDSTMFGGHTTVEADIGNDGGLATYTAGNRKDDVRLIGDGNSDALINLGKAADRAYVDDLDETELLLGGGKNFARIGYDDGVGDLTVRGGKAADDVTVYDAQSLFAGLGQGFNELDIRSVYGDTTVSTGKNADTVDADNIYGDAILNVRAGDNDVELGYVGGNTTITGKGADDDFSVYNAYGAITVNLGNARDGGMNQAWLDNRNASDNDIFGYNITANGGSGVDVVGLRGENDLIANLFEGNDIVNLGSGYYYEWDELNLSLGEDNDTANLGNNYLYWNDQIKGEGGTDTITAGSLAYLADTSNGGAFAGSDAEIVQTSSHWSGSFHGDLTGANAAGVMTYNLMGNINSTTRMWDMADNVQINLTDSGGTHTFYVESVVETGGTVNLSFKLSGSSTYNSFYTYDVDTLNVMGIDNIGGSGVPTLTLGSGTSFIADDELQTVKLSGSSHITMGSVFAENLSVIDGSDMVGRNVRLDLNNVAADILVTTNSGADYVKRDDLSANYDIDTGAGNDTVTGGGGDDDVKLGDGNDRVEFFASTLDTFDLVDGGTETVADSLYILNTGADDGLMGNDDFFFGISEIENWYLSDNADTLSLGNIAQTSGMEKIFLGNGSAAQSNSVTLQASFANPLEVTIGNQSTNDTVDGGAAAATLTVRAQDDDLNGLDMLTGGTGLFDELVIYDVNGGTANLAGVKGFEYITVELDSTNVDIDADGDNTVAAGETLTVVTNGWSAQGDLNFNALGETDGMLDVTGGWGADVIVTGGQNDTLVGNNGKDILYGGGGNDSILGGNHDDQLVGAGGNDIIDGGTGNDTIFGDNVLLAPPPFEAVIGIGGVDNITGGTGADVIWGGDKGDIINVGNSEDSDIDTLIYLDQTESFGGNVDQVSGFTVGLGGDVIDVSAVPFTGSVPPSAAYSGQQFVGNGTSFGNAQGLVKAFDGIVDVVFQEDDQVVWVDVNDDGTLNNDDLQIQLLGEHITQLHASNLILDI